jgi:hypothetical protein
MGLFVDPELLKRTPISSILEKQNNLNQVSERYQADYCLEVKDQKLIISRPGMPGVPLVPAQKYQSEDDVSILVNYLAHIAQFEFIKNLHNPNTFLFSSEPVELTIYRLADDGNEKALANKSGIIKLDYFRLNNQSGGNRIKIKLRNRSGNKLYVALLYLSMNFGVKTKLIPEVVYRLEPNKEVWAFDGQAIGLKMEPEIKKYDYPGSTSYLKLLVCTEDFKDQVTRFELNDLPGPSVELRGSKGLAIGSYNPGAIQDWTTRLVTLFIKNPEFREI